MKEVKKNKVFNSNRSLEKFAFILSVDIRYIAIIMSKVIYFLR